jgi:tetratricopeptide (TPR) repeat protein
MAYAHQDNFQAAFSDFNQALKINRHSSQAYYQRGKILAQRQKYEAAIIDFTTAIAIKPTLEALIERAVAYEANQQPADAIADYEEFLRVGGGKRFGRQAEIEEKLNRLKSSGLAS